MKKSKRYTRKKIYIYSHRKWIPFLYAREHTLCVFCYSYYRKTNLSIHFFFHFSLSLSFGIRSVKLSEECFVVKKLSQHTFPKYDSKIQMNWQPAHTYTHALLLCIHVFAKNINKTTIQRTITVFN